MDISEICYMIQRLRLYNLLTNKWLEKSLEQLPDQMKKAIKVPGS